MLATMGDVARQFPDGPVVVWSRFERALNIDYDIARKPGHCRGGGWIKKTQDISGNRFAEMDAV